MSLTFDIVGEKMDIERLKKHKFIVIGYEHYNPLGVIRSLGENGIHPIVLMLKSDVKIASKSKYIGKLYCVDSNEEVYTLLLREYGNEKVKPFVIPCDDNITELFDHKYAEVKDKFYVANAGEADRISHYMNKYVLCDLAKRHGLNVAKSWVVKKGEIPNGLVYPLITKPLTSYPNWKADYRVCNNEQELKQAYSEIKGTDLMLQQYISWTPTVSRWLAHISKGRTMREYIVGTMMLPTILATIWMCVSWMYQDVIMNFNLAKNIASFIPGVIFITSGILFMTGTLDSDCKVFTEDLESITKGKVNRRSAIPFYGLFVLFFFSLFISGIIKQPFAFNEYSSLIFMPLMVWSLIECWKILKLRNK